MKKILALFVLLLPFACYAGTVTVTWQPPTTCEDGSPVAMCPTTGFEVLEGTSLTGTYTTRETVSATTTTKTYSGLVPGQRCYSLKTVAGALKSVESTRACADIPALPPKAPQGISVRVEVTVTSSP